MGGHVLLVDRPALVTGTGKGISQAVVWALAREGARVAVTDMDLGLAEALAGEVEGAGVGEAGDVLPDAARQGCPRPLL